MGTTIIRCMDLPYEVKGFAVEDSEGDYNVYINNRMSYDIQSTTLAHELSHICRDDFHSDLTIEDVEQLAM